MTAVLTWFRAQLDDPTSAMHLNAFVLLNYEYFAVHVHAGKPFDFTAVWAAVVLFGSGGAIDVAQKIMALRGGKLP